MLGTTRPPHGLCVSDNGTVGTDFGLGFLPGSVRGEKITAREYRNMV